MQAFKTQNNIKSTDSINQNNDLLDNNDIEYKFRKVEIDIDSLLTNNSSFCHIPFASAANRIDNGSLIIGELCKIFQGRVDMEDREIGYSMRVSRPNLYENEIRLSTSERALGYLKNYYLFLSRDQATFRRQMDEEVVFELDNYKSIRLADVTKHKTEIEKVLEDVKQNEENLIKAKRSLMKTLDETQLAKDKLIQIEKSIEEFLSKMTEERKKEKEKVIGRFFSAFESNPIQEKEKQLKRIERLEQEAALKVKDIAIKKKILLESIARKDDVYGKALKSFEMAEKGRLQHTENTLRKFCKLEREALEGRLKLLTALEEGALTSLDTEADIKLYVDRERNTENTQRYSSSLQVMDWDYARRKVPERKISTQTDASLLSQNIQLNDATIDSLGVENENGIVNTSEETKMTENNTTLDETQSKDIANANTEPSTQNETPLLIETITERRYTNSSTSSQPSKSSLPPSHKFLIELVEQRIFMIQSTENTENTNNNNNNNNSLTTEELCQRAFSDNYGMDLFLQILDEKRGRCAELDSVGFHNMKLAMTAFLDRCQEINDVKSALRIANMSITFHMKQISPTHNNNHNNVTTGDGNAEEDDKDSIIDVKSEDDVKLYIQREEAICQHNLWSKDGFWEDALMIGLKAQLDMMEPVLWDELDGEQLKEKVLALHNIIFGQLGTLAFTMHEMGLPKNEVEKLILSLSEGAQLGEDQQLELMKSISISFRNQNHPRNASSSTLSSLVKGEVDQNNNNEGDLQEDGNEHDEHDGEIDDDEQNDDLDAIIEENNSTNENENMKKQEIVNDINESS